MAVLLAFGPMQPAIRDILEIGWSTDMEDEDEGFLHDYRNVGDSTTVAAYLFDEFEPSRIKKVAEALGVRLGKGGESTFSIDPLYHDLPDVQTLQEMHPGSYASYRRLAEAGFKFVYMPYLITYEA